MTFTTLNTIIEDILKIASGSIISASNPFSRRQIEDWVHQYRAILLARELDRDNYVNPDYIQEENIRNTSILLNKVKADIKLQSFEKVLDKAKS